MAVVTDTRFRKEILIYWGVTTLVSCLCCVLLLAVLLWGWPEKQSAEQTLLVPAKYTTSKTYVTTVCSFCYKPGKVRGYKGGFCGRICKWGFDLKKEVNDLDDKNRWLEARIEKLEGRKPDKFKVKLTPQNMQLDWHASDKLSIDKDAWSEITIR